MEKKRTRTGLLERIIREDLRNGQGICLIDPHGALYDGVVKYCGQHVHRGDSQSEINDPETEKQ